MKNRRDDGRKRLNEIIGIKHWQEDIKIKKKLRVSYFALLSAAILSIAVLSCVKINTVVLDLAKEEIHYSVLQLGENITNKLESYEEISQSVFFNKELMEIITKQYNKRRDAYDAFMRGRDILNTIKYIDPDVSGVSVKVFNDTFLFDGEYFEPADPKAMLYDELLHNGTGKLWTGSYKSTGNKYVIAFYKFLYEYKASFQIAGILQIEVPEAVIYDYIKAEANDKDIFVLDQNGKVVTASNKTLVGNNVAYLPYIRQVFEHNSGEFIFHADRSESLIVYNTIYNRWKVVYITDLKSLMADTSKLNRFIILICLTATCGIWLMTRLLAEKLTQRLDQLTEGVRKVGEGDYNNKIALTGNDEVGQLAVAYNQMTDKLKYMFEEVYKANITKKQAELWALQAQINPHFIYNSITSIRWMATLSGAEKVSDMLAVLSDLLHPVFSRWTPDWTLAEELGFSENYIKLMRLRYGNRVSMEVQTETGPYPSNKIKPPRLILQPLLENSCEHGILRNQSLHIQITVSYSPQKFIITVADDGAGFPADTLLRLNEGFAAASFSRPGESEKDGKGIGLINVNQRLRMRYGDGYGLTILDRAGRGSCIEIRIGTGDA